MLSFKIKDVESNYETIKKFCAKYRKELTVYGGILGEHIGLVSCDEYIEFMNSLSFDTFVGNYCSALLTNTCNIWYRPILKGENTFEEMIESSLYGDNILKDYYEKMESQS